jgi:monoterpene epsilon-lactone hydrolase
VASPESAALKELYVYWGERISASGDDVLDVVRDLYDGWGKLATEAEGVSFQTVKNDGVTGIWAIPPDAASDAAILYLHGGGYIGGGSKGHRKLVAHIAKAAGLKALAIDYRLAPEHPFPAQLDDSRRAFDWIVKQGVRPERIAVIGDSAGGALATAVALNLAQSAQPQCGAVVALSPYYDLECVGPSMDTNAAKDAIGGREGIAANTVQFLGPSGSRTDPYVNALHSDPTGLPPVLISFGGDEVLLDGGHLFAELARSKGVEVDVEVVDGMQHVFHFLAGTAPEADDSIANIGTFIKKHLGV